MRFLTTLAILTLAFSIIGCTNNTTTKKTDAASGNNLTDLAPMTSSSTAYKPEPVTTVTPAPLTSNELAMSTTPATGVQTGPAASGSNHVVKKGETLYSLARQRYGDGKQWQKIASANPGVSPNALKVGQTIVIP